MQLEKVRPKLGGRGKGRNYVRRCFFDLFLTDATLFEF